MNSYADFANTVRYRFDLPGGQRRLKEAALCVMELAKDFEYFGLVKLNKILWRADFSAFLDSRYPVTGRQYQKLINGPAPVEMRPLLREMEEQGWITYVSSLIPNEKRPAPLSPPEPLYIGSRENAYLREAAEHYRHMTAAQTSNESHGIAWSTRDFRQLIPYDAAIFDDSPLPRELERKLERMGRDKRWRSA